MKNIVLFLLNFLFAQFVFSQQNKVISHVEESDLGMSIAQHDTLLVQYKISPFSLEIKDTKDNLKNLDTVKTLKHLYNFYKSNEVFTYDSIHAKKQLNQIDKIIETEIKNSDGCGMSYSKKILSKIKEFKAKGETKKALDFYERLIILNPNNVEIKKEYEDYKQEVQNGQKK